MPEKKGSRPTFYDWCHQTGSNLLSEWVYSNDPKVTPKTVTTGSCKECITWSCNRGHEWVTSVHNRVEGHGCPYCAGKRVLKGFNDLESQCPELAKEWDYDLNEKNPDQIIKGSNKRAHWKCQYGHRWEAVISSRSLNGCGCPFCAGQKTITGVNDLQTLYPDIAAQWHPTKNGDLKPSDIMPMSNKKVYWLCRNGHESHVAPYARVSGRGCPICSMENHVSFNEKAIAYYLGKTVNVEESAHLKHLGKMELDVYLPDFSIAVEYDGAAFHKSLSRDIKKNEACVREGIKLYRMREPGCKDITGCTVIKLISTENTDIESGLRELFALISKDIGIRLDQDINLERDNNIILEMKNKWETENSLEITNPEIAKEWHPVKNGNLRPYMFKSHSNRKFWWQCSKGHEWQASINDRVGDHTGCPICCNKKIVPGINDLKTKNPEIAAQWDHEKNPRGPEYYAPYSNKRAWWICNKGHSYSNTINKRVSGRGCPICGNKIVLKGFNDLATTHPNLAKMWDHEKNAKGPEEYVRFANVKIHWICDEGHTWTSLLNGITDDMSCPYCSGKVAIPGKTDVATILPKVRDYWNFEKNELGPENYLSHSNKKVWWKCKDGHEWYVTVRDFYDHSSCPYCSGYRVIEGKNDFATKYPELMKEWHPTKNGDSDPSNFIRGGKRKFWWICEKNHEWQAEISNRIAGTGCPYCSGNLPIAGETDLATRYPDLAKEWHPTKNGQLLPSDFLPGSGKKVWWIGNCGHEWDAKISERTLKNQGCPYCANRRVLQGYNDLATTNPILAEQWHPTKNGNLKPTDVVRTSHKIVWWLCSYGHEWQAEIKARDRGNGCPGCWEKRRTH